MTETKDGEIRSYQAWTGTWYRWLDKGPGIYRGHSPYWLVTWLHRLVYRLEKRRHGARQL